MLSLRSSTLAATGLALSLLAGVPVAATAGAHTTANAMPAPQILPSYSFAEVGDLGGAASFALAVNRRGEVAGTARTSASFRPQHAFRHHDPDDGDGARDLGTLPGSTFSRALDLNDRGVAVGEAFTASPERSRAVQWSRDGALRDLGTLGGGGAVANAVNVRGDVVGASSGPDGRTRAALWPRGGEAQALPWLADTPRSFARAWDVATDATVVGQTTAVVPHGDHVDYRGHAVRWEREGSVTDLGVLEDDGTSTAYAIGGVGSTAPVVGEASLSDGTRAVVFGDSGPEALPTPGSHRHARANDITRGGDVVGHATGFYGFPTLDGAAVLWRDGVALDLNDHVPDLPDGWVLRSAEEVDERGWIVGYGTVDGQTRAFLLTPTR